MNKPIILDLFCGAGGAGMGYHLAGFDVIGMDINPQPDYPFEFIQADVLTDKIHWGQFNAVHASPPCQLYSITALGKGRERGHLDLIPPTRDLLVRSGLPHVIENVPGAPLIDPVTLCGSMFDLGATVPGFGSMLFELRRHRLFETNWPVGELFHHKHGGAPAISVFGNGGKVRMMGKDWHAGLKACNDAMGTPWITQQYGVSQAIPPAYTDFLGKRLRQHLAGV